MFELSKHEVEHLHLLDQGLRLHEARLQLVLQGPELQEALIVLFCFMAHGTEQRWPIYLGWR